MNPHAQPQPYLTSGERKCFFFSLFLSQLQFLLNIIRNFSRFFFFFFPRTGLFSQAGENETGKQTVYKHSSSKDQMKTPAFQFRFSLFSFGIEASSATFSRAPPPPPRLDGTQPQPTCARQAQAHTGEKRKSQTNRARVAGDRGFYKKL